MSEFVTDRTEHDVVEARKIYQEKILNVTPTELETLKRGGLNAEVMTRIENNVRAIISQMRQLGYYDVKDLYRLSPSPHVIYGKKAFDELVRKTERIRNGFVIENESPEAPSISSAKYDFDTFNTIEKIHENADKAVEDVKANYRECGAFNCGGE